MKKLLCPSMMCGDFSNLKAEVMALDQAGADILHLDIMDGLFVPNLGMGLQDVKVIVQNFSRMVDSHLMIQNPSAYVELFASLGVDILYIHPEVDLHPTRTLQKILDCGAIPGIAISPGTSYELIEPLLYLAEYVLVMTVNPGFVGQRYLEFVDPKIEKLVSQKETYGYRVIVDGACSPERIERLSQRGVDGFVLGTSALFGKQRPYGEIMDELRLL